MRPFPFLRPAVLALSAALAALPATAQDAFQPVVTVNDAAVTAYELEQRVLLLETLGAPGPLENEALDRLIDERLQLQLARQAGITAEPEAVDARIADLAEQAGTDPDNFVAVLNRAGVATQSVRDFVTANVLWRAYVRDTVADGIEVNAAEVDDALARSGGRPEVRVLLSEIILPARTPEETESAESLSRELVQIRGFEAFASAARNVSAAPTRERGGRVDWLGLSQLPPALREEVLSMRPGEVSPVIRGPNILAVFQLRGLDDRAAVAPRVTGVDYAQFLIPGGSLADARDVAARVDRCDDLYGIAHGLPPERLLRATRAPAEIPAEIARELDRLDRDEIAVGQTPDGTPRVLVLCARETEATAETDRNAVASRLRNRKISLAAENLLAELRADAVIARSE